VANVTEAAVVARDCHETHPEAVIRARAARQYGVVTGAQMRAAGWGQRVIELRAATGRLTRLHRGVYLVGPTEVAYTAEMAALLTCGVARSGLSQDSAGAVWGFRPRPAIVHVATTANVRSRDGFTVHRVKTLEVTTHHGLQVTTPTRTLVDLATVLPPRELERAVNEALVQRLTTHAELAAALPSRSSSALVTEPALTRSEAEQRLRELIGRAGLPRPRTNAKLGPWEVDALWPERRLVVEMDSYAFHSTRAAFERDRRKDAALVTRGYRVIRLTWRRLVNEPEALIAELAAALATP
jgi:very-short-patch-repair endonuclease